MLPRPPGSPRPYTLLPYPTHFRSPARRFVKLAHLGVGVGENDPAGGWFGLPLAIPAIDQFAARRFARVGSVDHIAVRIGADRLAGPSGSQLPGGVQIGRASCRERVWQYV